MKKEKKSKKVKILVDFGVEKCIDVVCGENHYQKGKKMQYKQTKKIIIDQRKFELLVRLGCPDEKIMELLKTGKFEKTGDILIDETLECLIDIREFENWGGKREGSGRPKKNQDENHLDNQEPNQVVDKDIDIDKDRDIIYINKNILINNKFKCENYPEFKEYIQEMPEDIIKGVEKWIIRTHNNKQVSVSYICRQFINFAKRHNGTFFKEG